MPVPTVALLKITMNDVKPVVLRLLVVPVTLRLDRLHLVLQAAIGWTDSHLYEIKAGDIGWGIPDPDFGDGPLDASKARLIDVIEDTGLKTLTYLYDFGDGWDHSIRIERIVEAKPDTEYPLLLEAAGRCPPEDVGGPWGYDEFLAIMADPEHGEHVSTKRWAGGSFDPKLVDLAALTASVAALARKWTRKPAAKRRLSS